MGRDVNRQKDEECRWVKPKLVCQVAFVEWTDSGSAATLHLPSLCAMTASRRRWFAKLESRQTGG